MKPPSLKGGIPAGSNVGLKGTCPTQHRTEPSLDEAGCSQGGFAAVLVVWQPSRTRWKRAFGLASKLSVQRGMAEVLPGELLPFPRELTINKPREMGCWGCCVAPGEKTCLEKEEIHYVHTASNGL